MKSILDGAFVLLSGPFGWLAGVLIAIGAFALAYVLHHAQRRGFALSALVGGIALALALSFPFALNASRARDPLGPFTVQRVTLDLAGDADASPISVDVWYPASGDVQAPSRTLTCDDVLALPLADAGEARRLFLYAPHFTGRRDDNNARLAYLASYGYVGVAIDDIAHDAPAPQATPESEAVRLFAWNVSSQEELERAVESLGIRARAEAQKALAVLDRLTECANGHPESPWSKTIDYAHVGMLGYSFGGSAAMEAATLDARIIALVALDSRVFGDAYARGFEQPAMMIMSDHPEAELQSIDAIPSRDALMSPDAHTRYLARYHARDLGRLAELAARAGSSGVRLQDSIHMNFNQAALDLHLSQNWLRQNPIAVFNASNLLTRRFFDVHLHGEGSLMNEEEAMRVPGVRTFRSLGMVPDDTSWIPHYDDADGANE